MNKRAMPIRPKAELPRGFHDEVGEEVRATRLMISKLSSIYEIRGFEPLSTSSFEYTQALGKYLPDLDRPNQGVFSLLDDDKQWMSLRYDLTAPLARYVAENFDQLAKPFRRYQFGSVWRNEKPGPGRFREFLQMDVDTVGTANSAADAEMAMIAADGLEAVGIDRGEYMVRVSNRKLMDGVLANLDLAGDESEGACQRLTVLRAIDKLDRLGAPGVRLLLGAGRKDDSGDFTRGADLSSDQIDKVMGFAQSQRSNRTDTLSEMAKFASGSDVGDAGLEELSQIGEQLNACGYGETQISFDPSVVRGLEYYTGAVFEAELTFEANGADGRPVRFGSVGGGGRYDDLVSRFSGQSVPSTGYSVGISRLFAALKFLNRAGEGNVRGPVVILAMDRDEQSGYHAMAQELHYAGVRAEPYLGTSGMKAQMKYANRRRAPVVVIEGTIERESGVVTVKDLIEGERLAGEISNRTEWISSRPAQETVERQRMVETVIAYLSRHGLEPGSSS
jgi:histidyl-tRNA synthetase